MARSALVIIMAAMLVALPAATISYAQDRGPTKEEIIDASYSGPIVQDAFWTDRTSSPPDGTSLEKVEVGPGEGASVLAVILVNRGLSEITSITGTLDLPPAFRASTGGQQASATYDSIVEPGTSFTLFFEVDVSASAGVQGYNTPLEIRYSKVLEVGQFRTVDLQVPFRVTGKVILDAEALDKELVPGSANQVGISINNKGSVAATGVVATISSSSGSSDGLNGSTSSSAVSIGQNRFDLGTIPANGSALVRPTILPSNAAAGSQTINVQLSFGNAYGVKQSITIPVGFAVLPRALESEITVTPGEDPSTRIITAGKIHEYKFTVSNTADRPLSDVLITLTSETDAIKVLGDSEWTVKAMDTGYSQEFVTQVFAPTSLIGDSTNFSMSIRYLLEGQTKTDNIDMGAYIDGEISIRAYEIAVNYIGGAPNVVGNLLNEGNTVALFTTIELVSAEGLMGDNLPTSQYLGDLEDNSPLPFSIPIEVDENAAPGTYPVLLRVTYKDNLRQLHSLDINSDVSFTPQQETNESAAGQDMASMPLVIGIGLAIAAAIAAVVLLRKRKKTALRRTIAGSKQDESIESLLDSQQHVERRPDERR